jgi:tetratricopeptide (TPR) repeat protein
MGLFDRLMSKEPELADAGAYHERACAKVDKGDVRGALRDYTRAIDLEPNHRQAYGSRGFAYGIIQKYREAIADLTRDIELNPDVAATYLWRGNARRLMKGSDVEGAIRDYSTAIEPKPNCADAFAGRARRYGFRGLCTRDSSNYGLAFSDWEQYARLAAEQHVAEARNAGRPCRCWRTN